MRELVSNSRLSHVLPIRVVSAEVFQGNLVPAETSLQLDESSTSGQA